MLEVRIRKNADATNGLEPGDVKALTERATRATFYTDGLTGEQVAANERIPELSGQIFFGAAASEAQHLAAAFSARRLAGFVIATRHSAYDLELDWLMVDPREHGTGLAARLMNEGLSWLGLDRPTWLTVIRSNQRAIQFYRKFGFDIDPHTPLDRPVPHWIMRRRPAGSTPAGVLKSGAPLTPEDCR